MRGRLSVRWTVLVAAAALAACGRSGAADGSASSDELHETIDDFHDLALEKRSEIERALEEQLESAREHLADIAALATEHSEQGRAKLIEELQRDEKLATAKLEELRKASTDQWHRLCRETKIESQRLTDQAKALFQDG